MFPEVQAIAMAAHEGSCVSRMMLEELDGKTLQCFCAPLLCHGDVLIAAIEWLKDDGQLKLLFPFDMIDRYAIHRKRGRT